MDTPLFSLPTRFSAGTRQSSKTSSALAAAIAHLGQLLRDFEAGKSFSMMKADIPCAPLTRSVLA